MAGTQEILREYMISLGFKIDKQGEKDFHNVLEGSGKKIALFSKGLIAAAAGIAAMAASFATSMDRLYYASQKASSTAGNLKALEFAGRQIGMTAEAVDAMVGNMVMTLRTDPGMAGWVRSLGVDANEARQGVDIWMDLIDKLREKPFYEGAQFAEMVGMSPDQLFQVETNLDRFKKAYGERQKMAKDSGLDQDKAAEEGRDLANKFGVLSEKFGIWIDKIDSSVLPKMDSIITRMDRIFSVIDKSLRFLTGDATDVEKKDAVEHPWWAKHSEESPKPYTGPSEPAWMARLGPKGEAAYGKLGTGKTQMEDTMNAAERLFGLTPGTMAHILQKESNGNDPRFQKSKAGAEGPFGIMPATQKEYGVKDPYDFNESTYAMARKMSHLRRKYHGDDKLALQAYNWGEGNLDRYLGAQAMGKKATMPNETKHYIDPKLIRQPIVINVNGAGSPAATASAVKRRLDVAAADQQRYVLGNTR